jgi:hypothetical protein
LRGKPCRVQGPDLKVKAGSDGRYPDALIDCGPGYPARCMRKRLSLDSKYCPRALHGSTRASNCATGRLDIQNAVLLKGEAAVIEIPDLGVALPFSLLYEGLEFDLLASGV